MEEFMTDRIEAAGDILPHPEVQLWSSGYGVTELLSHGITSG
jgi:hypothetical protein